MNGLCVRDGARAVEVERWWLSVNRFIVDIR